MEFQIHIIKRSSKPLSPETLSQKKHLREYLDCEVRVKKRLHYVELLEICKDECGGRNVRDLVELSLGELQRVKKRVERLGVRMIN